MTGVQTCALPICIPLIPTGGVTLENSTDFLKAGAIAVGLSSELFLPSLIHDRNWTGLHDRAKALIHQLAPYCIDVIE